MRKPEKYRSLRALGTVILIMPLNGAIAIYHDIVAARFYRYYQESWYYTMVD